MIRTWAACLLLATSFATCPALGEVPTAREQAVAIDRVSIPPSDNWQVERIGPAMKSPWSIAFLPGGDLLITEKHGGVRIMSRDGRLSDVIPGGPPNVLQQSDSGLLDIVLDPEFDRHRDVYIAFAEGTTDANRTAIWKARLDGSRLTDGRVIFRVGEDKKDVSHPGGRMLFLPDNTLLLSVGDGYDYKQRAQEPGSHLGKVLRLSREGSPVPDNPFAGRAGYAAEVWTMGHRNIQGLIRDPATGQIWAHEHGPRGGDEMNLLDAGKNYGWPLTTNGIDYDGKLISERAHAPGIVSPKLVWAPSIAPSGLAIYHGTQFPDVEGKFLVGGLASRNLVVVRVGKDSGLLVEDARVLGGLKERIRDIRVSPEGDIFILSDGDTGRLYRVTATTLPGEAGTKP